MLLFVAFGSPTDLLVPPSVPSTPSAAVFHDGQRWLHMDRANHRLVDVATGRTALVEVADTALVRAADRGLVSFSALGVQPVRAADAALGFWVVRSTNPNEDGVDIAVRLSKRSDLRVYPNLSFRHHSTQARFTPNDPDYAGQWFFPEIDLEEAWQTSRGSSTIRIAIIDNGCALDHPDLINKFAGGLHLDVVDDDDDPSPGAGAGNEHGTACAGLAAASTDNNLDIAGACPDCLLSCIRLLPDDGGGVSLDADVRAFAHARDSGVAVVSSSWGFIDACPVPTPLAEAILDVQANGRDGLGAVVVFAAGNDNRIVGDDELLAIDGVIGVGAVTNLGELTQYTNRGNSVDVVAPTGAVTTDLVGAAGAADDDVMSTFGGTSSACPIVAGVAGLLLSQGVAAAAVGPLLEATAKQSFLAEAIDDNGHDDGYGYGRIDPVAALATLVIDDDGDAPPAPPPNCACHQANRAWSWQLTVVLSVIAVRARRRP